jgi:hypothetical protein
MLPGAERDSQGSVPIDHLSQSESLLTEDMALQKDTHGWGHWDLAARDEIKRQESLLPMVKDCVSL